MKTWKIYFEQINEDMITVDAETRDKAILEATRTWKETNTPFITSIVEESPEQEELKRLKEKKCNMDCCFNIRMSGLIYCKRHMYGADVSLEPDEIEKLILSQDMKALSGDRHE